MGSLVGVYGKIFFLPGKGVAEAGQHGIFQPRSSVWRILAEKEQEK
jgi:hypothetical protein